MQDQAITAIGKLVGNKSEKPYQDFIENMFPAKKNYDMILAVFHLEKQDNIYSCTFDKIDIDTVSSHNYLKYAYRKGSARGGDITFTTKFGDLDKKFKTFYPKQVGDMIAFAKAVDEEEELAIFEGLSSCLAQYGDDLKNRLEEEYKSLDKKKQMSTGFSIRFTGWDDKAYLEDFASIQKLLSKTGTAGKSEKYNVISEGHNERCSVCHLKQPVLHGFASPFKYATVDKTGLVSGFFKQENNWRNYPICTDCALDFELGKNYVTEKLSRYFYGKSFFIIPKLVAVSNDKLLKKALQTLAEVEYTQGDGKGTRLATREDALMRRIGEEEGDNNLYTLNLLFYEENTTTKAIKIKLFLEEILPSRFRKLFVDVPKTVNANPIFKEAITIKKEARDLQFHFGILKTFFENDFYEIIQTVFLGLPLAEEVLFSKYMQQIRANYNRTQTTDGFVEPTKWTVLKAMMTHAYLKALNIISNDQNSSNMEIPNNQMEDLEEKNTPRRTFDDKAFRQFIEANKDFFDLQNGAKVGVFAVGVLVRQVFNLQAQKLDGNTPFEKKLKGFNLNPEHLKNIYLDALEKISNYTNFYAYKELRNLINEYFILNSHQLNKMSNNELSFYFVAGLEFGNNFKTKKSDENE